MKKTFGIALLLCAAFSFAQTPVSLAPLSGPFLYTNGPLTGGSLAFGCVFTYVVNTTTPLATYTDYTGVTANANPVVLSAGGYGSIWFQSGLEYSIRVVSSGGINCAAGQTQYTISGVNQSLLNLANVWQLPQTFDDPITILAPDLQIVFGAASGSQTILDIPPTSGNFVLHGPPLTASDTLLSATATQTVTNKNLSTGTQINGCGIINGPGTYICIPNNSANATIQNALAIFTGAPSTATAATTTSVASTQGIVVSGAGITGNATIQQSGTVSCIFDNATNAGDFVIVSTAIAGDCSDSGVAPPSLPPSGVQTIGQVLSSNLSVGTYLIDLYPPGIIAPAKTVTGDGTPTIVNANVTTLQVLKTSSIGAGQLNAIGKSFRVMGQLGAQTSGSGSNFVSFGFGTDATLGNPTVVELVNASSNDFFTGFTVVCTVTAPGVTGSMTCFPQVSLELSGPVISAESVTVTADFTSQLFLGVSCRFTVASVSNKCTQNEMLLEQLN